MECSATLLNEAKLPLDGRPNIKRSAVRYRICINVLDDYQFPEEHIALEMMDNNNGNECVQSKRRGVG